MAGAALIYDLAAVQRLASRIERLGRADRQQLLDAVGAVAESQTRRRLTEDKAGPDGVPWPEWSERYAATRHAGQSLLEAEGDLVDSIGYFVAIDGSAVEIGTNLVYAASHQFGDERRGIPQREFIGLSDGDEAELEAVVDGWLDRVVNL